MTARSVDPEEGKALGFVLEIHPQEELLARAKSFANRFRHAPIAALGIVKQALNQLFNLNQRALADMEAFAQAMAVNSDFLLRCGRPLAHKQPLAFDWDRMSRQQGAE